MTTDKDQILIIGGGTAGITVAARMLRKGYPDVAVIEPSTTHYYQPLWTLVGGGQANASTTARPESAVMPKQATWIRNAASAVDPDNNTVTCADGATHESARASNSTGTKHRDSRTRWAPTACRRTTNSTSPRAPGISSARCGRAPRCS